MSSKKDNGSLIQALKAENKALKQKIKAARKQLKRGNDAHVEYVEFELEEETKEEVYQCHKCSSHEIVVIEAGMYRILQCEECGAKKKIEINK